MSQRDATHWEPAPAPAEQARLVRLLDELRSQAARGDALSLDLAEKAVQACSAALHSARQRQQQQLDDILSAVSRLAAHDFSHRLPEPAGDEISDYIVHGVNMLAEVLEETTVSRRYLDAVVDTMVDPLLVVSAQGIQHANVACAAQLGVSRQQLIGLPLERFMRLGDDSASPLRYADLLERCAGGPVRELAVTVCGEEGRAVMASVNASLLENDVGHGDQLVLVIRDMTGVLGLLDAAHKAVADKSRFVASVSHELRTPMQGVIAMTSMMLQARSETAQRDQLMVIQRSAQSLVGLVDDLLQLSKLDAGHMQLEPSDIDPAALAHDVVALLSSQAQAAGLQVSAAIGERVPARVRADENRLRQVFTNLLGNAIKFTERGHAELRVTLLEEDGDRTQVRFEVVDTGVGIAAEDLAAVFEPFVQRSRDHKRFAGTGLGLAISRHLVSLMGADLRCESVLGQGSRFWFDLELERATGSTESTALMDNPWQGGGRVLIADDEPSNRAVLVAMLQSLGAQADAVANGREAVEAIARGGYDLVLMDWEMPEMNGLQATRAIRAHEANGSRLPIVCLTGHAKDVIAPTIHQAGFDTCMQKPFLLSELMEVLSRFFKGHP